MSRLGPAVTDKKTEDGGIEVGFKSFAPHVRASDEEEKCLPQVGNGSRGMDGCAVQGRGGLSARLPATAAGQLGDS